jgi:hypothetical protein
LSAASCLSLQSVKLPQDLATDSRVEPPRIEEGLALHDDQMRGFVSAWVRGIRDIRGACAPAVKRRMQGARQQLLLAIAPHGAKQAQPAQVACRFECHRQLAPRRPPQHKARCQREHCRPGQKVADRQDQQQGFLQGQPRIDCATKRQHGKRRLPRAEKGQVQARVLEDVAEVLEILKNEGFAQGVVFGVADQHQKQHPGEQRAGGKERPLKNQQ